MSAGVIWFVCAGVQKPAVDVGCLSPPLFHLIWLFLAKQPEALFKDTDTLPRSLGLLQLQCPRAASPYFWRQSLLLRPWSPRIGLDWLPSHPGMLPYRSWQSWDYRRACSRGLNTRPPDYTVSSLPGTASQPELLLSDLNSG